jgi:hypothetical protein
MDLHVRIFTNDCEADVSTCAPHNSAHVETGLLKTQDLDVGDFGGEWRVSGGLIRRGITARWGPRKLEFALDCITMSAPRPG